MVLIDNKELDVNVPERIIFTDNGAYDLEKEGITGYYTWVGYEFDEKGHSDTKLERELEKYVYDVIKPAFKGKFGISDSKVMIEDRRATSAMFRVWVATYEK